MKYNYYTLSIFFAILIFIAAGCSQEETSERHEPAPTMRETTNNTVAGLQWTIPENWEVQAQRQMRVATYATPAAEGDEDKGEVAIFYFGPDEGGSVEANVNRWFGQFDQPDGRPTSEVTSRESTVVNSIPVTIVRTTGTYNAAAGPMAPREDIRPGYKLIGAIAEGPEGAVFYKFTGPEATVQKAEQEFYQLIESIRQQ